MIVTGNLTKNFGLREIACNDKENMLFISPQLVDHAQRLQKLRDWYGRPIKVNSWFRTKEHNAKIGGEPNSQHCLGVATDIALPDEYYTFTRVRKEEFLQNIKKKWAELCAKDGLRGGVGFYQSFIHLDSRTGTGSVSFWDER